jgi:mRNA-degrading endonuclease RelE of RelBE toxin-antitoxin system
MYKVIVGIRATSQIQRELFFWANKSEGYANRIAIEIDELINYVLVNNPHRGSNSLKKPGYKLLYPGDGDFKLVYKISEKNKIITVTHFFHSSRKMSNYI